MSKKQTLQDEVSHWISREREGENLEENQLFNAWIKKDENKTAYKKEQDFFFELTSLPKSIKEDLIKSKIIEKNFFFLLSHLLVPPVFCFLPILVFLQAT